MAILAKGTTLTCNGTEVGELLAITPPKMSVGTIEVTHLNSASHRYREGLPEGGEASGKINYDPSVTLLTNLILTPAIAEWVVTFSDESTWTWDGILTAFEPGEIGVDGKVEADFTIKVDGLPTIE